MTTYLQGRDAAYPRNLQPLPAGMVAVGYYGGPNALNVWDPSAWRAFKLAVPSWVGGMGGTPEGAAAVLALRALGVPQGKVTMLDIESRVDRTYVEHFGAEVQAAGYRVWVYGSTSTVFRNPPLNGYAVADPTGIVHMYPHHAVRMTQWAFGPIFDNDAIKEWLLQQDDIWQPS